MITPYYKTGDQEEIERFKKASAECVRLAKEDPDYAREFLTKIGFFDMQPKAKPTASTHSPAKGK